MEENENISGAMSKSQDASCRQINENEISLYHPDFTLSLDARVEMRPYG